MKPFPTPTGYERLRRSAGFFPASEYRLAAQPICHLDTVQLGKRPEPDWYEFLIRPRGKYAHLAPARLVSRIYAGKGGLALDRAITGAVIRWIAGQPRRLRASINVHPSSLGRPAFIDGLLREIEQFGLEPDQVCLELVEFAKPASVLRMCKGVRELKQAGVLLALDDYGKGLPNFELCGEGTVDYIKIDGEYVRRIGADSRHEALIRGILAMAAEMGIEVVAEGVEQEIQLDILRRIGAQWVQGFLVQRPRLIKV